MKYTLLSQEEASLIKVGEAVSLTTIMAIAAAVIMVVVVYKLLTSTKGSTTIPGGWKFTWN